MTAIIIILFSFLISAITIEEIRFKRENKQFYEGLNKIGNTLQGRHDKRLKEFKEFLELNK